MKVSVTPLLLTTASLVAPFFLRPAAAVGAKAVEGSEASAPSDDPLSFVLGYMDELTAKIVSDGEKELKSYKEFFEWCDDTSKTFFQQIESYTAKQDSLEAKIVEVTEDSEACSAKIDDLAARIADNEKDLKAAKKIYAEEKTDFEGSEAMLVDTIDTLTRATAELEKVLSKNPGSFAQVDMSSFDSLLNGFQALLETAALQDADKQKLVALIQSKEDADDEELGAPKEKSYETKSGGIVDVLDDMKEKAEGHLDAQRRAFLKTTQEYKMQKQSLETQLDEDNKDLTAEKTARAEALDTKATAETDLQTTKKLLAEAKQGLALTQADCQHVAADHDASIKGRTEELQVIAQAKKILQEANEFLQQQQDNGPADDSEDDHSNPPESLFQLASLSRSHSRARSKMHSKARSKMRHIGKRIAAMVQRLAKNEHSKSMAQLASHIQATFEYSGTVGGGPFGKVGGLLKTMIAKLEKENDDAAAEKAYCDEQLSKTGDKKDELEDNVKKLKVKMDEASSSSAKLKEEVNDLQTELATLAKEQGMIDQVRRNQNKAYVSTKKDLEKAIKGTRKALGVLKEYYGNDGAGAAMLQQSNSNYISQPKKPENHVASGGAGGAIIATLEVIESDLAKNLAEVEKEEADAQSDYEKISQENAVTKKEKEQDVKYKTQQFKTLDNELAEMKESLAGTEKELSAVNDYLEKVQKRCVAKPEAYAVRAKRRDNEIKGLRETLGALGSEAAEAELAQTSQGSSGRDKKFLRSRA